MKRKKREIDRKKQLEKGGEESPETRRTEKEKEENRSSQL